jgi:hypothetical protein
MRRSIIFLGAVLALVSCKPEEYTGPLDSPVGSWDGVRTEYYFNGEEVGEADLCEWTAISFYKDGLCCIEGVKGSFPYTYEHATGALSVDNTLWKVHTLTGAEMVIEYIETIFAESTEAEAEETEPEAFAEYKGISIYSDKNGYYYENSQQVKVYCKPSSYKNESGETIIEFWYDRHIDHFIPLVVEVKK